MLMWLELCSFEEAKDLKEIGFPQKIMDNCYLTEEYHDEMYDFWPGDIISFRTDIRYTEWVEEYYNIPETKLIVAPSLELVAKWLREEKHYAVVVESSAVDIHSFWINNLDYIGGEAEYVSPIDFKTYDEALRAGIDNVIEQLKENKE